MIGYLVAAVVGAVLTAGVVNLVDAGHPVAAGLFFFGFLGFVWLVSVWREARYGVKRGR